VEPPLARPQQCRAYASAARPAPLRTGRARGSPRRERVALQRRLHHSTSPPARRAPNSFELPRDSSSREAPALDALDSGPAPTRSRAGAADGAIRISSSVKPHDDSSARRAARGRGTCTRSSVERSRQWRSSPRTQRPVGGPKSLITPRRELEQPRGSALRPQGRRRSAACGSRSGTTALARRARGPRTLELLGRRVRASAAAQRVGGRGQA